MPTIDFTRVTLEIERTVSLKSLDNLVEVLADLGLSGSAQEQLWVIALDSRNKIRNITTVSVGTYHDCFSSVPTVLSPVLLSASDRFILAHNHPNGHPNPTEDDLDLNHRVQAAAEVMDMEYDDHIIVTPGGAWVSLRAMGHL